MPRAIDGRRRKERRKKILKLAKGYQGRRSLLFRTAKDAVRKAGQYAYRDRRVRKRDFRRLWIMRINAACRDSGIRYSEFVAKAKKADVLLNRKVLAYIAMTDIKTFNAILAKVK